jgi:hypothetical protein
MAEYSYIGFAKSFGALFCALDNSGSDMVTYMKDVFVFPVGKHYLIDFRSDKPINHFLSYLDYKNSEYSYDKDLGMLYRTLQYKDDKVCMATDPVMVREDPVMEEEDAI